MAQSKVQNDMSVQIALAEYARLQAHAEFVRQARDVRVNWYTAILGGVAAGVGLAINGEHQLGLSHGDKITALDFVFAFLILVGFHTFEAAQRHNLSSIAGQIQMARIRQWLATLDPKFETILQWKSAPEGGHWRSLWVPTITLTINTFVAMAAAAFGAYRLGFRDGRWQFATVIAGLIFLSCHLVFAYWRLRKLRRLLAF